MFKPASLKLSLVLALAALLLLCLYSWLNMNWWQQELLLKLKLRELTTSTASQNTAQDNELFISEIALPQAPTLTVPVPSTVYQQDAEQHTTPLSQNKVVLAQAEIPELKAPPLELKHEPKQEPKQEQTAKLVYAQLQADNSLDVQIALPATPAKQQHLLNYLYRCAGVQFAVLQQQQLRYISPQRYVPVSQWLRVANGPLSEQEQQWLAQQNGTAIRVFPQTIDQRLAQYLATHLKGTKLTSLRATYDLTPAGLALTNIQLNKHSIKGNWLLHQNHCNA